LSFSFSFFPLIPASEQESRKLDIPNWNIKFESKKAILINIAIMRAFVKMRELIDENKELKKKLDKLENKYDKQFKLVFNALRLLIHQESKPKNPLGFIAADK